MSIEETREIVRALVDDPHTSVDDVMIAADAYGAARELKGHVDACEAVPPAGVPVFHCGAGWLCDVGKEIEEAT